ncbi:M4 family metallopeptidase [Actinokineospora auranticolor]|uniref:Zn-dependent metalloprotease n=1 Tax=Actinokineospora auranticolor TaxID=155976 RepID=A0A2S6GNE7_9PSEU|nr:M4 family metallopeptidase [Actinokineospora auranticolor]PPK66710.1 Zn-dependent metalloprotease [Actinokineospora auranticolor]
MSRKAVVAAATAVATAVGGVVIGVAASQAGAAQDQAASTTRGAAALSPQARAAELDRASGEADSTARLLGLGAKEKLVAKDVVVDTDGTRHVRYDRTYDKLPVLGGDLVVHRAADGRVNTVDKASGETISVATTTPAIAATRAAAAAPALTAENKTGAAKPELIVYAAKGKPVLAYRTTVEGAGAEVVVTDAASGALLDRWEKRHEATGNGYHVGTVDITTSGSSGNYTLTDASRGNTRVLDGNGGSENSPSSRATAYTDADNVWGNGQLSNRQTIAVDAYYGLAKTWDFYKNTYGRNGIRNNGQGHTMYVHIGSGLLNAFYDDSCFCMVFGDGSSQNQNTPLTEIDVVGHEMTHGVTAATANLNYSGESGGLNESASDIFGTMVEFSANNPNDPGDYYIGEKLRMPTGYFRRMDNPAADGSSLGCWRSTAGQVDVHYSSGIGNRWFYLASEGTGSKTIGGLSHTGGTCNSTTFAGIGKDKAAAIFYRALSTYMTSTTNYAGARTATLQAAADLYGTNSQERYLTSVAWAAVSVGTALPNPGTTTPPTSTTSPTGPTTTTTGPTTPPTGNAITNGGFESGQTGWSEQAVVTNSTQQTARTGSYYAWLLGNGSTANEAISQQVTVPSSGTPTLRYWLKVTTQETGTTAYDTLKVQVNGTTKVTYSNANASSGYVERTLDMSAYKGQTVTLRFAGVEDAYLATNFLLDDVSLG